MGIEFLLFEVGALDQSRRQRAIYFMGVLRIAAVKITITGVYNCLTAYPPHFSCDSYNVNIYIYICVI